LASVSRDSKINVFYLETGSILLQFEEKALFQTDDYTSIKFTKDSSKLILGNDDKIFVWDLGNGTKLHDFDRSTSIIKPGKLCCPLLTSDERVYGGFSDSKVCCWSLTKDELEFHVDYRDVEKTKRNKDYAVNHLEFDENNILTCWWSNGKSAKFENSSLISMNNSMFFDIFAKEENLIALSKNKKVTVWQKNENTLKQVSSHAFHDEVVTCLKWLPQQSMSARTLVVGSEDKTISVWNFRSNEGNFIQEGECDVIVGMGAPVDFIVPVDQHTFVTGSKNVFYLKVWQMSEHRSAEQTTFLSQRFISKRNLRLTRENHSMSKCGNKLAIFSKQNTILLVFDVSNYPDLKVLHKFSFDKASNVKRKKRENHLPVMVRFSDYSEKVYCAFKNGRITMTPLTTNEKPLVQKRDVNLIVDDTTYINCACLDFKEKYLVVNLINGISTSSLTVIDTDTFKVKFLSALEGFGFEGLQTEVVAFLGEKKDVLNIFLGSDNGDVHLFSLLIEEDTFKSSIVRHRKLKRHSCLISHLALNFECNLLLSGTSGNSRILWKRDGNEWVFCKEIVSNTLLNSKVSSTVFSRDNQYVIIGSYERNIKVYETKTGNEVASLYVYAPVVGLSEYRGKIFIRTDQGFIVVCQILSENK